MPEGQRLQLTLSISQELTLFQNPNDEFSLYRLTSLPSLIEDE
jgi:hypothetical protein